MSHAQTDSAPNVIRKDTEEEHAARIAAICLQMTKTLPERIAALQNQRAMSNLCSGIRNITLNP